MAESVRRKISAIPGADVLGYSRLMEDGESATVSTLEAHRETVRGLALQQIRLFHRTGSQSIRESSII